MSHMLTQKNQEISLSFPQASEEETTFIFSFEDLIKEYNHKILTDPALIESECTPLSLRPLSPHSDNSYIRPMTQEELDAMHFNEVQRDDWDLLKKIFLNRFRNKGLIRTAPTIAKAVSILNIVNALGLQGKVYYKTVGDKTYVILKGIAKDRPLLKGTRYLSTHPQIVQLGLAKVSFQNLFKKGFKSSIWVYSAMKAYEAVEMVVADGELKPSFFSEIGTAIPKMAITALVTAAAGGVVAVTAVPVAIGSGVVLVVGFGTGIAVNFLDEKIGLTEKLSEAVEKMWENLKEYSKSYFKDQVELSSNWDPLKGFVFSGHLAHYQRVIPKGNHVIYTA